MYDIDKQKMEQYLYSMEQALAVLEKIIHKPGAVSIHKNVNKYAAERCLHICIEVVADVGNLLIDGFIMRDPGSYEDIVEILRDEGVISEKTAQQIKEVIHFRKPLVHHYTDINQDDLFNVIKSNYESLIKFPLQVREYLDKELI